VNDHDIASKCDRSYKRTRVAASHSSGLDVDPTKSSHEGISGIQRHGLGQSFVG
jgi:hypothetical protein